MAAASDKWRCMHMYRLVEVCTVLALVRIARKALQRSNAEQERLKAATLRTDRVGGVDP